MRRKVGEAEMVCTVAGGGQEQVCRAPCAMFHLLMRSSLNSGSFLQLNYKVFQGIIFSTDFAFFPVGLL